MKEKHMTAKIGRVIKVVLLAVGMAIVAWSATTAPGTAEAVTCQDSGHSCHSELPDGTIAHLKEYQVY